jgi:hypothetical protein
MTRVWIESKTLEARQNLFIPFASGIFAWMIRIHLKYVPGSLISVATARIPPDNSI